MSDYRFGHAHTVPTADASKAVGGEFVIGGKMIAAPIGIARSIAKLAEGPAILTNEDRAHLDVLSISTVAHPDGRSSSMEELRLLTWYGVPTHTAPPPAAQTIFRRPQR